METGEMALAAFAEDRIWLLALTWQLRTIPVPSSELHTPSVHMVHTRTGRQSPPGLVKCAAVVSFPTFFCDGVERGMLGDQHMVLFGNEHGTCKTWDPEPSQLSTKPEDLI